MDGDFGFDLGGFDLGSLFSSAPDSSSLMPPPDLMTGGVDPSAFMQPGFDPSSFGAGADALQMQGLNFDPTQMGQTANGQGGDATSNMVQQLVQAAAKACKGSQQPKAGAAMQPAPARQPSTAWHQPLGRAPFPQPTSLPPGGGWQPMQASYAGQPWYGATPTWPGVAWPPAAAGIAGMQPQYLPSTSVPCAQMPPYAQNGPVQSMQFQQAPMSVQGPKGALPQQSSAATAFPQQPVCAPSLPQGAATCTVGVGTAVPTAAVQPLPAPPAPTATASPPQSQRAGPPSQAAAPPSLPVLQVRQAAPTAGGASTCVRPAGMGMPATSAAVSAPMALSGTCTATSTTAPSAVSTDSGGAFAVHAPASAPGAMSMLAAAATPVKQPASGMSGQAPAYATRVPSVQTVPTVGPYSAAAGLGHVALEPCRVCGRRGVTVTKREPGTYSWGWVACMTLFLLPLCCIPLMAPSCLDAKEVCPFCQAVYSTKSGGPDSSRAC
jgi:hypothetical protein